MNSEDEPGLFELHFAVKDYCFAREDRLVGVCVMQLNSFVDAGSCTFGLPLAGRITLGI